MSERKKSFLDASEFFRGLGGQSDIGRFLTLALEWAVDLLEKGIDPISEIQRIKEAKEELKEVGETWKEELEKK
jgi:hypothetical protein